jgi:uncharacterized protein (TIGR03437 family)
MFTPDICIPALMEMRRIFGSRIYKRYGFVDAFHPTNGWTNPDVIGIDVGITLLSAENLRTGNVWSWFLRNLEIKNAMSQLFQGTYEDLDGVTSVSAASYRGPAAAPASIAAAFGSELAPATQATESPSLPNTLAGVTVKVTDSADVVRPAPLFFVSPGQINYLVPAETAEGPAVLTVETGQRTLKGYLLIRKTAPGLFTASGDGQGVPSAYTVRLAADGSQTVNMAFQFDEQQGKYLPRPIGMGAQTDLVFLVLFGTGIRGAATVNVAVGDQNTEADWFGPQSEYPGLDQVNILLPRALAGRGTVELQLTADGTTANPVVISMGQ